MLPDLRIVIAAVVSTFICTVGVGFYASSRLLQEPLTTRTDNPDDSPINRIALSWPEPLPPERMLNLDFAVTAKVAKNPVRDISEPSGQPQSNAVATPSSDAQEKPAQKQAAKETARATGQEVAREIGKDPPVERMDKLAAGMSLVEPDPHRLTGKLAAGPSLVEPDPHRLETDPQATGSVADAPQSPAARPADQKTATLPDLAETEQEASNALASKNEPTTRIRIVKKPVVAKARIKRKPRVAATPPASPALPTLSGGNTVQLQFPFMFFLGTSSPN